MLLGTMDRELRRSIADRQLSLCGPFLNHCELGLYNGMLEVHEKRLNPGAIGTCAHQLEGEGSRLAAALQRQPAAWAVEERVEIEPLR